MPEPAANPLESPTAIAMAMHEARTARAAEAEKAPKPEAQAPAPESKPETAAPESEAPVEEPAEQPAEAPAEETPAADDDAGPEPTVAPPAGWTAEDKAWFNELPTDRQQRLLRRELDLQRDQSRLANEHRERLAQIEREAEAARTERQYLAAALQAYVDPTVAEFRAAFPEASQPGFDPVLLARTDPARFSEYQAYQDKFNRIAATRNALAQREAQEREAMFAKAREAENARLQDEIPELKDPKAWGTFANDVVNYLRTEGYEDGEIKGSRARDLKIARKAMLWDRAQAAARKAQTAPKPQPAKVLTPGTAQRMDDAGERVAAATKQLRANPNSTDATAAVLAARREARARAS